jgi:hypothetical protein
MTSKKTWKTNYFETTAAEIVVVYRLKSKRHVIFESHLLEENETLREAVSRLRHEIEKMDGSCVVAGSNPFLVQSPRAPYSLEKRLNLGLRDFPNRRVPDLTQEEMQQVINLNHGEKYFIDWDAGLQKFSITEKTDMNRKSFKEKTWIEPQGLELQYFPEDVRVPIFDYFLGIYTGNSRSRFKLKQPELLAIHLGFFRRKRKLREIASEFDFWITGYQVKNILDLADESLFTISFEELLSDASKVSLA